MSRTYDVKIYFDRNSYPGESWLFESVNFLYEPKKGEFIQMPPLRIAEGQKDKRLIGGLNEIVNLGSIDDETEPKVLLEVYRVLNASLDEIRAYHQAFLQLRQDKK